MDIIENVVDTDRCYSIVKSLPLKMYTLKEQDNKQKGWISRDVKKYFPKSVNHKEELDQDQIMSSLFGALQKMIHMTERLQKRIQILEENIISET